MDIRNQITRSMGTNYTDMWFDIKEINQSTRDKLWSYISTEIDSILDEFYNKIENSNLCHLIQNAHIDILKHKQINHWRRLFLHAMNDEYSKRILRMHDQHAQIGLLPQQYIVSYLFLLNLFQKSILRQSTGPKEAYELMQAMNFIVANDITHAIGDNEIIEI